MKTGVRLLCFFLVPLLLYGQAMDGKSKQWIVRDRDFSREFLGTYIDLLMKMDPMADLEIQETDEMRVAVLVQEDGSLKVGTIHAKSRGGALNKLDEKVIKQFPPEMIQKLLKRQYQWDYIDQVQVAGATGEIINVFQERNYKQCRDAFWWTHRRVDIAVFPRMFLRINPKFALSLEIGREDIGFPVNASGTMNVGLATEVFKFHITMPVSYPGIKGGDSHPLDGSYGAGLKFDTPKFGGSISFQDMGFRSGSDPDFYEPEHIVYNSFSGHIFYSFTNRIGTPPDQPGMIPQGSLRMKFGAVLSQYVYGYQQGAWDTTGGDSVYVPDEKEKKFKALGRTDKLNLVQGFVRAEYASDMNERYFNKWKLFGQLNIGLTGFGSLQLGVSYTIREWLGVNLATAFFWSGIEFDNKQLESGGNPYTPEESKYNWTPGFYLIPSVSIYF